MLKIIPIGGMGTVTKNMFAYEINNQILLVDCGIGFPDESMLGIDILIPDVSYLESRKNQIIGMLLTHPHDDHIAGLPYILPKLGNIPIYASKLTRGFALDRIKEFGITADLREIGDRDFRLGHFTISPIKVTHSVPDARHFAIKTPIGVIYHGSDYKFDPAPIDGIVSEIDKIRAIGDQGVLCLLSDCLRSEKSGHSQSESILTDSFKKEFQNVAGKLIITIMSSNIHRIQQAINVALSYHRSLCFVGRSVESNVKTAARLGLLKLPQTSVINKRRLKKFPPEKLAIIIAGSQGQPESSLSRAVAADHNFVSINPEDKVVFASDAIPGNENPVYSLIDDLSRIGCDVAYPDLNDRLHVSGHAYADEQLKLINLTKPKFLLPIGGTFRHMVQYRRLATTAGFSKDQIAILEAGQVASFTPDSFSVKETIPLKNIMVDGLGVGDVGNIVLRDRQAMAEDGIVVLVVPIEAQTGKVKGEVEVISRGFVYMRQSKQLVQEISQQVKSSLKHQSGFVTNWTGVRKRVESRLEKFLFRKTKRRPLVLTFIMEV